VRSAVRYAVAAALVVVCWSWTISGSVYAADLIAQVTAQALVVAAALGAWWLARRHLAPAVVVLVSALGALVFAVLPGRVLTNNGGVGAGEPVRVLVFNALAQNERREAVRDAVVHADADVVALLEAPAWLIEELRAGGEWRERYPHYFVSDRANAGFKVVMSRWAQHDATTLREGAQRTAVDGLRQMVLDRPGGAFAFTMIHPHSPRSPGRWARGNEHLDGFARRTREHVPPGMPHVAAGDLNATPTGSRSRRLARDLGLRRAKPLFTPAGTMPAWAPWPFSLAIDDAVVSSDVGVVGWRAVGGTGSDHRAVIVDLDVPPGPSVAELIASRG
jgi:endonuclease/exonuclease/phosphatase (EEP) superfamily protein YafD